MIGMKRNKETEVKSDCDYLTARLVDLQEGETAVLKQVKGGHKATLRLAEMGLTPGTKLQLLRKCAFHGPVEISIRGVSLALGFGLASKVCVQPLKADASG